MVSGKAYGGVAVVSATGKGTVSVSAAGRKSAVATAPLDGPAVRVQATVLPAPRERRCPLRSGVERSTPLYRGGQVERRRHGSERGQRQKGCGRGSACGCAADGGHPRAPTRWCQMSQLFRQHGRWRQPLPWCKGRSLGAEDTVVVVVRWWWWPVVRLSNHSGSAVSRRQGVRGLKGTRPARLAVLFARPVDRRHTCINSRCLCLHYISLVGVVEYKAQRALDWRDCRLHNRPPTIIQLAL